MPPMAFADSSIAPWHLSPPKDAIGAYRNGRHQSTGNIARRWTHRRVGFCPRERRRLRRYRRGGPVAPRSPIANTWSGASDTGGRSPPLMGFGSAAALGDGMGDHFAQGGAEAVAQLYLVAVGPVAIGLDAPTLVGLVGAPGPRDSSATSRALPEAEATRR